uniref:Methyltransferase type 11 domain-containing protein n=1 Tax=Oryctolagus cuniculus TaxID=9986 RepID=A0A5F9DMR7_RABIT
MEFATARRAILQLLGTVAPADLPALLQWMRTTRDFDEFTLENNDIILKSIAEDLRNCLPPGTVLSSEQRALQKILEQPQPTVHVDAFLYDDDFIDSLCEKGKMSRNYCTVCGSHQTAPLGFISHSFSLMELKFIYHHVLPDLSGKILVDVGSRLGTVLYGGYLYSSAMQLYGVELNGDFCQLQEMVIKKYQFGDRIKVLHADICTQGSLLQNADVIIMNNVFEYFLNEAEQARYVIYSSEKSITEIYSVPYGKRYMIEMFSYEIFKTTSIVRRLLIRK